MWQSAFNGRFVHNSFQTIEKIKMIVIATPIRPRIRKMWVVVVMPTLLVILICLYWLSPCKIMKGEESIGYINGVVK